MAPPLASAALLASSAAGATPTSRPPPPPRTVAAARAHSASISEGNSRQSPGAGSSATSGGKARSGSKTSVKREAPSTTEEDAELAAQKEANRKRPKPMLSCIECKRRKIKCDRKSPCEACSKGGRMCTWDETRLDTAPQPFAMVKDLATIAGRLADVERFLQTLPPELRAGAPVPSAPFVPTFFAPPTQIPPTSAIESSPESSQCHLKDPTPQLEDHSAEADVDMEHAALVLENVALLARAPGAKHGVIDSIPFFENIHSSHRAPADGISLTEPAHSILAPSSKIEMTTAMTCIVAPPFTFDNAPLCAVQLGLDIGLTDAELPGARLRAIENVCKVLPSKETSFYLVSQFFELINWLHHSVDKTSFYAEHVAYWNMVEQGRQLEVCPIWLALYSMILSLSLDGSYSKPKDQQDPKITSAPDTGESKPLLWYTAAQRLLDLGDWRGRPQVRTIFCVILFGQWIQLGSAGGQASRFLSWLASGIRIAQLLGLHQLGESPESMPADDPCWPPGKNSIKREGALRVFSLLVFMDYMSSTVRFRSYMINLAHCTTPPLSNVNDADLSATEWRVMPKPPQELTDSTYELVKYRMALVSKKVFDTLVGVSESSTFSYDRLLELDSSYKRLLDELPPPWKGGGPDQRSAPHFVWKRNVMFEALHSRIVRLHRPFFTRGYTPGSRFAYSTQQCLISARQVIYTLRDLISVTNNIAFIFSHALAASIVLFADLFHAIDHELSEEEIDRRKVILHVAAGIFSQYGDITAPSLRAIVQTGNNILVGLFKAEEKRRMTRAASALVGGRSRMTPPEPFSHVLHRISHSLDFPAVSNQDGTFTPNPYKAIAGPSSSFLPSSDILSAYPAFTDPVQFLPNDSYLSNPDQEADGSNPGLISDFYRDLGLSQGGANTFDFWTGSPGVNNSMLGVEGATPGANNDFSFLAPHEGWMG